MPQLEQLNTYVSQIIWLTITFVGLYLFLRAVVIPRIATVLEERQQRISEDLDRAAKLKAESEELREAYEQALATARSDAQAKVREVTDAAREEAEKQSQALSSRISGEIAEAEKRIGEAKTEALADLKDVAAGLAQDVTQKLIGAKIDAKKAGAAVAAAAKERG